MFEVIVTTKGHKIINRTNYEEELTNLVMEMDSRRNIIVGGNSKWKLFFKKHYLMIYMKIKHQDLEHI